MKSEPSPTKTQNLRTAQPGKVRLGVIGLGRVFWLGYLPWLKSYLRKHPHVKLAAVCDLNEKLGVKYSRKFGCEFVKDPDHLISAGKVDAVIINTPTWTHEKLVIRAAESGLHILCEKPMAATVGECDRMLCACKENGVLLSISFMRRFNLGFQKVRELVQKGAVGEVVSLEVVWPYFIPDIDKPPYKEALSWIHRVLKVNVPEKYGAWRLKDPRVGGGDFLDHGPHIIDFFKWVAGDVTHISGDSRVLVADRNEDYTKCVLKFKSGATGYITTTLHDFKSGLVGKVYGSICGTEGRIDFVLPNVDKFKPIRYVTLYREPETTTGRIIRTFGLLKEKKIRLRKNYVFEDQLDYFVSTILNNRQPHPVFGDEYLAATGEDGRYTIIAVELCYTSSKSSPVWLKMS